MASFFNFLWSRKSKKNQTLLQRTGAALQRTGGALERTGGAMERSRYVLTLEPAAAHTAGPLINTLTVSALLKHDNQFAPVAEGCCSLDEGGLDAAATEAKIW